MQTSRVPRNVPGGANTFSKEAILIIRIGDLMIEWYNLLKYSESYMKTIWNGIITSIADNKSNIRNRCQTKIYTHWDRILEFCRLMSLMIHSLMAVISIHNLTSKLKTVNSLTVICFSYSAQQPRSIVLISATLLSFSQCKLFCSMK